MVGHIALMLEREARVGTLAIDRLEFAAQQFPQLVVSLPQRRALGLGTSMTKTELDAWAGDCVNLFLHGCRFWQSHKPG